MKPIHTTLLILVAAGLIAWGIWYYFKKKAPAFDMDAYNSLGNQGILQGNLDYPYLKNCGGNCGPYGNIGIPNSINYVESGGVADPTYLARARAEQQTLSALY